MFYFISRTKAPHVPWINHSKCSDSQCIANHIQETTYQNRHVTQNCSCKSVHIAGIHKEKLLSIVRRGGVPLIKIQKVSPDDIELQVIEHRPRIPYVAISHVWSDGLGNPYNNALPFCQLKKLHELLEQHPSDRIFPMKGYRFPTLFWIDTLCIPPYGHGHPQYSLRLDCIDRMALIYANAWDVFVLDHGLQQIKISACSYEELIVHLICCAWNQRCWTLQEGALSCRISFQLADGIITPFRATPSRVSEQNSFQSMSCAHGSEREVLLRSTVRNHLLIYLYNSVRRLEPRSQSRVTYNFEEVWNALQKRTTTMPEDLYVVFANLLGYHPYQLASLASEQRLKAIILNMDRIPLWLLYHTGKRVSGDIPSQRWIPAEICRIPQMVYCGGPCMERTAEGFVIASKKEKSEMRSTSPGLISIEPPITRDSWPIWLRCKQGKEIHRSNSLDVWIRIDLFRASSHEHYDPGLYKESCILIEQHDENELNLLPRTMWKASLLHIPKGKHPKRPWTYDVVSYATYDCPARVTVMCEQPPDSFSKTVEEPGQQSTTLTRRNLWSEWAFAPQTRQEHLLVEQPPWKTVSEYELSRVWTSRATMTEDDCYLEQRRFSHTPSLGCRVYTGHSIRFHTSWKLVLETREYMCPSRHFNAFYEKFLMA